MRLAIAVILAILLTAGCIQSSAGAKPANASSADTLGNAGGIPYMPFTKSAYESAKDDGKVIFLEFYANWCPVCASQEPDIIAALGSVDYPDVAAFRVNYKDSDTDSDEQDIAREFGITYQHTHIILDSDGSVFARSSEVWDKDTILSRIDEARGG